MQNEGKKESWPCPSKDAFCSLIVGRRGSGKSSLILKQLLKGGVYHKQFNLIVIISPTVCLDPKWRKLDPEGIVFFDEYQDSIIDTLIEEQTGECFRKRKVLVIMDDCANERVHKTSKSIGRLACNGRHLGISVIFSSQRWVDSATNIRGNVDQVICFAVTAQREITGMFGWFGGTLKRDEFSSLLEEQTKTPYSYLNIRSVGGRLKYFTK
jgi:hypothetical protein